MEPWPTEQEFYIADHLASTASLMQAALKDRMRVEFSGRRTFLTRYSPLKTLLDDDEFAPYERSSSSMVTMRFLRRQQYRDLLQSFIEAIRQGRKQNLSARAKGKYWPTYHIYVLNGMRIECAIFELKFAVYLHAANLPVSRSLAAYAFHQISRCFFLPVVPIDSATR